MILITQPIIMAIISIMLGRLSDKFSPRWLASSGMAISVIGLMMLAFLKMETSQTYIVVALAILGLGFGLFSSLDVSYRNKL